MQKSKAMLEAQKERKERAKVLRPLVPQLKKGFKKKMAEMTEQANQIQDEKHRTIALNLIKSCLRGVGEYRDWDELFEFVESSTDVVRMAIALGLYGLDPRTDKVFDAAQERAIDRDELRNLA